MTCTCPKVRHASKHYARKAIKEMRSKGKDTTGLNVYRCPDGTYWHVGHATAEHKVWRRAS